MSRSQGRIPKPSLGTILGGVALMVALSGTAVALPGTNRVNSGDVVPNTLRAADIRADAVGNSELKTAVEDDIAGKQDKCEDGSVRAYAQIDQGIGSVLTTVDGYNCTGGTIQARQTSTGVYEIAWGGITINSTVTGMVAHINATGGGGPVTGVTGSAAGRLKVDLFDVNGAVVDKSFHVTLMDPGA